MRKILSTLIVILITLSAFAQTNEKMKHMAGMTVTNSVIEFGSIPLIDTSKAYSNMETIRSNNMDSIEQMINGIVCIDKLLNTIYYAYGIVVHTGMDATTMYNNLKACIYNEPGANTIETSNGCEITIKKREETYVIRIKDNRFLMTLRTSTKMFDSDLILTEIGLHKFYFSNYMLKICQTHDPSFDF